MTNIFAHKYFCVCIYKFSLALIPRCGITVSKTLYSICFSKGLLEFLQPPGSGLEWRHLWSNHYSATTGLKFLFCKVGTLIMASQAAEKMEGTRVSEEGVGNRTHLYSWQFLLSWPELAWVDGLGRGACAHDSVVSPYTHVCVCVHACARACSRKNIGVSTGTVFYIAAPFLRKGPANLWTEVYNSGSLPSLCTRITSWAF